MRRAWKAFTASSKVCATLLTVWGLIFSPKSGAEGNADLSRGQTQEEAGENKLVDLPYPSGIGGDDPFGAEQTGPGYGKHDRAELGEDTAYIAPVSPIRNPFLECPGQDAGQGALPSDPSTPSPSSHGPHPGSRRPTRPLDVRFISLITFNASGKVLITTACFLHGYLLLI